MNIINSLGRIGSRIFAISSDGSQEELLLEGKQVLSLTNAGVTLVAADAYRTVLTSAGAADRTVALPALTAAVIGREYTFVKTDSGVGGLILDGDGADTVNGETSITLAFQGMATTLVATRAGWYSKEGYVNSFRSTAAPSSGAGTSPTGIVIRAQRRGTVVSLSVKITTGATGAPNAAISWASATLPVWARPLFAGSPGEFHQLSNIISASDVMVTCSVAPGGSLSITQYLFQLVGDVLTTQAWNNSTQALGYCNYDIGE